MKTIRAVAMAAALAATCPAAAEEPQWNAGAGLGSTTLFSPRLSSPGVLSGSLQGQLLLSSPSALLPALGLFLERRLGNSTWLLLQGAVTYDASVDEVRDGVLQELTTAQLLFGPRFVAARGVVDLSFFVVAGVGYAYALRKSDPDPSTPAGPLATGKTTSWTGGITAGIVLERELSESLALRFSSGVLGAGYTRSTSMTELGGARTDTKEHGPTIGLRFSPAIELRLAF